MAAVLISCGDIEYELTPAPPVSLLLMFFSNRWYCNVTVIIPVLVYC